MSESIPIDSDMLEFINECVGYCCDDWYRLADVFAYDDPEGSAQFLEWADRAEHVGAILDNLLDL